MIEKILPLLNKLLPEGLAFKGLQKLNPKIGRYFANAAGAGYGIDEAMGFLRDQYAPEQSEDLRPDQRAGNARVQQGNQIPGIAKTAGKAVLGGAGIANLPGVIGNMFQEQPEKEEEEEILPQEEQRRKALQRFNEGKQKRGLAEDLQKRFDEVYGRAEALRAKEEQINQPPAKASTGSNNKSMLIIEGRRFTEQSGSTDPDEFYKYGKQKKLPMGIGDATQIMDRVRQEMQQQQGQQPQGQQPQQGQQQQTGGQGQQALMAILQKLQQTRGQ